MGDVIIGPQCNSSYLDRFLCAKPAALLVSRRITSHPSPIELGAYSPPGRSSDELQQFQVPTYPQKQLGYVTYFSSAPLSEILCAQVFEDSETGLCRGILLEYSGRAPQAVGQCRIGLDQRKEYKLPSTMYTYSSSLLDKTTKGLQVRFGNSSSSRFGKGWELHILDSSMLYFWFSERDAVVEII